MEKRSVVLVASSELARRGVRSVVEGMDDIDLKYEITCMEQLICPGRIVLPEPDVVLMTLEVNGLDPIAFLSTIRRDHWTTTKIICLAMRCDAMIIRELAEFDLSGYLLWDDVTVEGLTHCLAAVLEKSIVVTSRAVARAFIQETQSTMHRNAARSNLTIQEIAILRGLSLGFTQREVAFRTGNSLRTVSRVSSRLEKVLNCPSQFALGAAAARLGILEQPDQGESATPTVSTSRAR